LHHVIESREWKLSVLHICPHLWHISFGLGNSFLQMSWIMEWIACMSYESWLQLGENKFIPLVFVRIAWWIV
jgi:hypothetical protein